MPAALVNGTAAVAEIRRHRILNLVHRRLGGGELFAVLDDGARLRELCPQLLGVGIRNGNRRGRTAQEAIGRGAGNRGASEHKGEPSPHAGDAIVSPATCLVSRRLVPGRPAQDEAD
jgi:hypothetical protein